MARLTLEQFRDIKRHGFPGWETAVVPGFKGATPYVDPVDVRYRAPSPLGADPAMACAGFDRWCTESLTGDYFVVAGTFGSLVYCQLSKDAAALRQRYSANASRAPHSA